MQGKEERGREGSIVEKNLKMRKGNKQARSTQGLVKGGKKGDIERHCREIGPRVLAKLESIALSDSKRRLPTVVRACEMLLDRGYGKPRETVDTGVTIVWDIGVNGRKAIKVKPEELPKPPKQLIDNQGDI